MINSISSGGVHAADFQKSRETRAKNESAVAEKSHPAHPHGKVPPGLARAAERISAKIFSRADADANGTVTEEELGAIHSKHARTLASSDLFQSTPTEPPTETEPTDSTTTPEPATETETASASGITPDQLKEALTRYFYAKVGAVYTPPAPAPPAPTETETSNSMPGSISEELPTEPTLSVLA